MKCSQEQFDALVKMMLVMQPTPYLFFTDLGLELHLIAKKNRTSYGERWFRKLSQLGLVHRPGDWDTPTATELGEEVLEQCLTLYQLSQMKT